MSEETKPVSPTRTVLPVVMFNLLVYFVIGLPNAVIGALFVGETLGYDTAMVGTTITLQYLGTLSTRLVAGQLVDKHGPKPILKWGMFACTIAGLLMILAALIAQFHGVIDPTTREHVLFGIAPDGHHTHGFWCQIALGVAWLSRLFIGWAESWTATSVTTWNMRRVGPKHTSVAISWNGVTSYGGMTLGAMLGKALANMALGHGMVGLCPVGVLSTLLAVGGLTALILPIPVYKAIPPLPRKGAPMSFFKALRKVFPFGTGLAAGSVGFGTIIGFLAPYLDSNKWSSVYGWSMGAFAIIFIAVRMIWSDEIDRRGGMPVAVLSLLTEGLAALTFLVSAYMNLHGIAGAPYVVILGAALMGAGFSLLFPSLGTMAVKTAGPEYSGILLAAYSIFTDATIFVTGPSLGSVKDIFGRLLGNQELGWICLFALGAFICFLGIVLMKVFLKLSGKESAPVI
ncbi:MFS transporter [Formicincola oecophyllae]|uniref:MFS transporter n=1 Tax=Formicincola oecophyllae TaxID=2558361 RepID=UPI00143D7792|nr:MFS transporter [Formicincola oecophyllae]